MYDLKNSKSFSSSFGSGYFDSLIDYVQTLDKHVQTQAKRNQSELSNLEFAPKSLVSLGPKYPSRPFSYLKELTVDTDNGPLNKEELFNEVSRYFRGAIRPESKHSLFNMVPEPSLEATAAAMLATAYNTNTLMDAFGGEALLVEQQVARRIGHWADWPESMGIACNGGKLTIMYAIKSALSRIDPNSQKAGLPSDVIILCSEGAHYCVEHAASLLGLGSNNCLRVPTNSDGKMHPEALRRILNEQHALGKKVAAIICCGGTTINFNCEDTQEILNIVESYVKHNNLHYKPYLHLDSVIGWLYLSNFGLNNECTPVTVAAPEIRHRVAEVHRRFRGLYGFDSLGVDFHKNGLCPYASSFFIAKDNRFMNELGDGYYHYSNKDFQYGDFRAYRYTFENSRPSQGILSAWINLQKLGRSGYASYLTQLHEARESLTHAIEKHGLFRVLNQSSLGWEVVFEIPFSSDVLALCPSKQDLAMKFMQQCWDRVNAGHDLPLFSIVPEYRVENDPKKTTTAFLLYPMSPRPENEWDEVVKLITAQFHHFQNTALNGEIMFDQVQYEKPIR
ncbi:aspartate aminotransferase family protein [Vibrio sp. 10N.261.46.E12]|uniref:pyridoxal phosphate-dependent decarboxylase family protein n=1 Tax=unclassified Vibrio TaxID=2614977 RepID=UPI0009FA97E6|nr:MULTISPECIES: pyridoxal-dependent decarboxylase [unclassified Vibrio]